MIYNFDIVEAEIRDGHFVATCRETGIVTLALDPEHDACHDLSKAGHPRRLCPVLARWNSDPFALVCPQNGQTPD